MLAHIGLTAALLGTVVNSLPTNDLPLSSSIATSRISPSARQAPKYWTPPMKSNIQFILTGIPDVDDNYIRPNTGIYEIDMFWTPAETISKMKELGQRTICYFSAATAETWRSDYKDFDNKDLGLELPDWPGERYLDIRRANVLKVIKKRIDLAASKGCDAIEPDNVDVYSNDNGFTPAILPSDTITYLSQISAHARSKGMSVGIKNCIEILGDIFDDVDFAISEECVQYRNCTVYANFTTAPRPSAIAKPVFEVEYVNYTYSGGWSEDGVALQPAAIRTSNINTVIKTLALDGFAMYCDGSVERTATKDVEGQTGPRGEDGRVGKSRRSWARESMWRKMGGRPVDP
ncbi:glycoside hydrolase family 114 protein [Karstenula rhodostoma CBS 690.94]|uniref:alpha-galactosidase n=1 Tax=Karstenula rhodostoma CBS 690.94 TaxID=1392251 RepID=A0A9P4P9R0_9PLEO|nr:glycoside hydrolase family 114 protein [Karstenula rhodostoma CBS 690.94]